MKLKIILCWFLITFIARETECKENSVKKSSNTVDFISSLKDTLVALSGNSDNEFFKKHCNSLLAVINSKVSYTSADSSFLLATYNAFNNVSDTSNASLLSSYLKRERPFVLAWVSPTDGAVSFSRLKPPKNWDPQLEYPVYIQLHGLTSPANSIIEYVTKPFRDNPSSTFSYEDGYMLSPWGRGNLWYQGISEIDIWEGLAELNKIVKIDHSRQYITGHSMGGYGTWSIASKSANTWAAIGIHAGALWYNSSNLVNADVADIFKDLPTYFVCGTSDGLLGINQTAYSLLENAGNQNIQFVTFTGGHEYVEKNVENMYLWLRDFVNDDWNTGIIESSEISQNESAIRCYPNPVLTTTTIKFTVSENSSVNIDIYDIYGRFITKVENETGTPGEYSATIDAKGLSPGIYFIRMKSGTVITELKMIVAK